MSTVAIIDAVASDRQINGMALLDRKPIYLHTLEKIVKCEFIDEIYLVSDLDDILEYASYLKYTSIKLNSDKITDIDRFIYDAINKYDANIFIWISAFKPFIKVETIKNAINILNMDKKTDLVTFKEHNSDLCELGFYVIRGKSVNDNNTMLRTYIIKTNPTETFDVNSHEQYELAEYIAKGIHNQELSLFRLISRHLSSCIFSDILWEYDIDSVITELKINLPNTKLMGRANTLALRKLDENEDFKGIYGALKTYETIREGDIIIVENECPDYAYFGELNTNLSLRVGAIGTVVAGVTRDIEEVTSMQYPVFAKGYSCRDIRGIGTMKSHNQPICINGIRIEPGDLIFADKSGVVVIPKSIEEEVLKRAMQVVQTEKNVISKIIKNEDAFKIYEEEGTF